eukprot:1548871-Rhodomonas_salina.1
MLTGLLASHWMMFGTFHLAAVLPVLLFASSVVLAQHRLGERYSTFESTTHWHFNLARDSEYCFTLNFGDHAIPRQ